MAKRTTPYPARIKWQWDHLIEQVRSVCLINPVTGCWVWTRWASDKGYGRFSIDGETWYVHRAILKVKTGITRSHGLHSCDNPPCANPDHLRWGTQKDNMADALDRQRIRAGDAHYSRLNPRLVLRGSANGAAKLTADQVREIRERYSSGGISQQALGTEYGICQRQVSRIIRGERWAPAA